jgi:plasmid maintenance system killer protein
MSSLQDLIKKIQVSAVITDSYVYYTKETGKIHKISSRNVPNDEYEVIAIPQEEVKPILSGERRTEEFTITYDLSLKQIKLKEIAYDDSHNTASTMCYQLPIIKNSHDAHVALEHVYEGVEVYVYDPSCNYSKGQCVWYNNNVYKLATDTSADTEFDLTTHKIFVEDVVLTVLPTQNQYTEKLTMQPEYVGVRVDVWYKELSHLAGQHVWLNGTVYKLLKDQSVDTEFTMENAEVIVSNVKLYADENKSLKTVQNVVVGDMLLDNNQLYSVQLISEEFDKDKISIFFFNTASTMIYYNNENVIEADLSSIHETITYKDLKLNLIKTTDLKNGQTILSGKQLYQVRVDREYDIIVQQNTQNKTWTMMINPYTKKFLQTSGYKPTERLYFSVTSKYDPNILYRSLEFTVGDLLSDKTSVIPFITDLEQDSTDVSIYTAKYFDSYAHEVI